MPNKNASNHNNPRNNIASIRNPNIPPIKANGRDSSEKQNLNKSISNGPKHLIKTIINIIVKIVVNIVYSIDMILLKLFLLNERNDSFSKS